MTWHWNCDDCGMTGGASSWPDAGPMAEWLAQKHADSEGHRIRLWPRGMREETRYVEPTWWYGDTG